MPKIKQKRFEEMKRLRNVSEYTDFEGFGGEHPFPKGIWRSEVFGNENPLILELACGKGEYSVNLAQLHPENNYIGVDIKGNRMWVGATKAKEKKLKTVHFLRAYIDHLDQFFTKEEVDELWILFPDPYEKKERKRLTSPKFLKTYRSFVKPGSLVHLKTDSNLLYKYTKEVIEGEELELIDDVSDVHAQRPTDPELSIKTYYERMHIKKGKKIKYLSFRLE